MDVDRANTVVNRSIATFACMVTDWLGRQHRLGNRRYIRDVEAVTVHDDGNCIMLSVCTISSVMLVDSTFKNLKSLMFVTFLFIFFSYSFLKRPGRVAQSVGLLTRKSGVLGSIPGLATYFCFSFRFFKKGSCQLLAKVCARSTG